MSDETTLSRPRLAQGTLLLASMLTIMAGATISPALPAIQREFANAPNAGVLVGLVLTMHGLFIAVGSPSSGHLQTDTAAAGCSWFRRCSTHSPVARGSC
ncbi:hypothetical protein ACFQL7_24970 [Halocatena marina]|uniref:Major facilitator superfamily (MFS) profile domain-containing protein n=1 Tax=Halocatena marina TaxID=2934937 RepID=A0ABD5YU40_9EURY